jgi:hypothetical protein
LIGLSACTASASTPSPKPPTPTSTAPSGATMPASSSPTTSPAATTWAPYEATPTTGPDATDTSVPDPTDSPTPPLPKGPLPSLAPVPTNPWTGLTWIAIPGGHSPALPAADSMGDSNATIEGWTKGYIDFVWNPARRILTPWVSQDGLSWSSGPRVDISTWSAELKEYDQGLDAADRADCTFDVLQFEEGPEDLLLRGTLSCGGGCGGPWFSSQALWSSSDAASWTPVDMPSIFGAGGIGPISGGAGGFIALGAQANRQTVWTSTSGSDWRLGALPSEALSTGSWANNPTSFAGGFVLPGVVLQTKGHGFVPKLHPDYGYDGSYGQTFGCMYPGLPPDLSLYRAALWWSADGTNWTRITIGGTTAANSVDMTVTRIDDHTLLAEQRVYTETAIVLTAWISTDGKSWARLVSAFPGLGQVLGGRGRSLIYDVSFSSDGTRTTELSVLTSDFKLHDLKQTGQAPWIDDWQTALGPSGLLVTADGSRFWLDVPTA